MLQNAVEVVAAEVVVVAEAPKTRVSLSSLGIVHPEGNNRFHFLRAGSLSVRLYWIGMLALNL